MLHPLLLKSAGCRADTLPQNSDSSSFIDVTPERAVRPFPKGAARTGTNILIPQNFYSALVGQPRSEAETRLGVSLHAARRLASKITDTDVGLREAFEDFVAGIKQDGFVFPERFKLGLVFYVDVKRRFIKTDHAFVVIPKGDVLAVVEKDNSPGPYVRADFESEKDLVEYVSLGERRDTNNPKDVDYSSSVIVSLNDRLASIFHPSRQP
jgi:hypothetical protein